jgi:hypothetical protein
VAPSKPFCWRWYDFLARRRYKNTPRRVKRTAPRTPPRTGPAIQALDVVEADEAAVVPEDDGVGDDDKKVETAVPDAEFEVDIEVDEGVGVVVATVASQLPPSHCGQHW